MLTTDKQERKERPIARGVMDYFPDAIAEVAHVSFVGNQQHNPGESLHWAREKSTDHADCIARHLIDRGTLDDDGMRHTAKAAWRALAMLQIEIEAGQQAPDAHCITTADGGCVSNDPRCMHNASNVMPAEVYPLPETEALNNYLLGRFDQYNNNKPAITEYPHDQDRLHLIDLGCMAHVARQIVGGMSYHGHPEIEDRYVYIAGPMRGYEKFNFPAFDMARDAALRNMRIVISPADIDRHAGLVETEHPTGDASKMDQRTFVYRDFYSLFLLAHKPGSAIAMLPGWEKSTGAVAEFFLARWLGLKVLDARTGKPLKAWDSETGLRGFRSHDLTQSVMGFLRDQKEQA